VRVHDVLTGQLLRSLSINTRTYSALMAVPGQSSLLVIGRRRAGGDQVHLYDLETGALALKLMLHNKTLGATVFTQFNACCRCACASSAARA
jgi:hypothetical protein